MEWGANCNRLFTLHSGGIAYNRRYRSSCFCLLRSYTGSPWIREFVSPKCASMLALNEPSTSISSSIRREYFRIDWRDSEAATGRSKSGYPSGKESIYEKNRIGSSSTRQGHLVGEEKNSITTPKKWPDAIVFCRFASPASKTGRSLSCS